jgi:N-acyl homoserine lactone hydrolase
LNPYALKDPIGIYGEVIGSRISISAEDDVRNRLKELNLNTDDIRYVVNSHLHWDHTGGNQFFKKSKLIVQKAEYRFAYYPDNFAATPYLKNDFDYPLDYQLIEGDMELVPGVSLVAAPGHTPGLQVMIVTLPQSGTVVLTSDSIYTRENIAKDIPAGNCWNAVQSMESMHRIVHIAKREKGRLFITHDPDAWDTLKPSPYCYR